MVGLVLVDYSHHGLEISAIAGESEQLGLVLFREGGTAEHQGHQETQGHPEDGHQDLLV